MSDTILYLSDRWLTEADSALAPLVPLPDAVSIAYQVTGGPTGGSAGHQLVLGPDRVRMRRGTGDASVTMTLDWALAVAINQGTVGAQRAVLDGRIAVSGDPSVLLGHRDHLAAIDDTLGALRARTVYATGD